jgi:hypothetical protein
MHLPWVKWGKKGFVLIQEHSARLDIFLINKIKKMFANKKNV